MCLHTWHHPRPRKPSSCTTFMPSSHWGTAATVKKSLAPMHAVTSAVSNSLRLCSLWPVRLPCQGGASPGKNTGVYWPVLVAIPGSVQFSSVAQSCLTLCDPMNRSMPGLPVQHQLLELSQTHAHRMVMPSSHLVLCRPLLLLPPTPPSINPARALYFLLP